MLAGKSTEIVMHSVAAGGKHARLHAVPMASEARCEYRETTLLILTCAWTMLFCDWACLMIRTFIFALTLT